jgi:uncharacterized repeat protein (TIGR01451 family)
MNRQPFLALGLLLGIGTGAALGQQPAPPSFSPDLPPPLFVRFSGPPGVKVTFYRGAGTPHTFDAPFTVGLRPGYAYRVEVAGMPRFPGVKIYPSLEVYGSLTVPHCLKLADHPAAIHFRDEDFQSVLADSLVTKAVTLERPDSAIPLPTDANQPLEIDMPPPRDRLADGLRGGMVASDNINRDPVKAAAERGRVVMVMKVGERQYSPQELAAQYIPGTVLLPGEQALPMPHAPPCFPPVCFPYFDPKLGPASPASEICFWDGGDRGLPVGYGPDGRLRGLDPSDTIAEYQDSHNQKRICVSNRVCLCVPRFLVFRAEIQALTHQVAVAPNDTLLLQNQVTVAAPRVPMVEVQRQHLIGTTAGQRVSITEASQWTAVTGRLEGLDVIVTERRTFDVNGTCVKPEEHVPECLQLNKWPDRCGAAIGEIITFYLKYTNKGGRAITNVVVSDSLTNRLEYVPGSARADRDAVFTTQANEAGSVILRWEINDPLPPGQSGTVSFQVRVR